MIKNNTESEILKIGLYLANAKVQDVDMSELELGNPGIGGSHFLIAALPYYFEKYSSGRYMPILYANSTRGLPVSNVRYADNVISAMEQAKSDGCDCFIDVAKETPVNVVAQADRLQLPTIFWIHNIVRHTHLRAAARSHYLRRVVCSAGEAFDYIRDHMVFPRLALIPNGFDATAWLPDNVAAKDGRTVVYLGNIVKQKGFHILARVWPRILARCPDARLKVIGSGQLYDRSVPLGKWGVATDHYERKFLYPYLADQDGLPIPSVEFLGLMGNSERAEVMKNATVGVVNPSGETENCPGSALEFQASGTPVVSGAYWGLLDTVVHEKTGLLGRTDEDLVDNICRLLENPDMARSMGENGIQYVSENYDYRNVVAEWEQLCEAVVADQPSAYVAPKPNLTRHAKWLRVTNERVKRAIPFLRPLPSVSEVANALRSLKRTIRHRLLRTG